MSGREWKPGDVAVATFDHGGSGFVFRVVGAPTSWCDMAGVSVPADQITDARPLAVIDPEDREQVERLRLLFATTVGVNRTDALQAALREFANPTPEEPTVRGSVVKDSTGLEWVRVHPGGKAWVNGYERWASWAELLNIGVAEVVRA